MDYYTILTQKNIYAREFAGATVDAVRLFDEHFVFIGFDTGWALKLAAIPDMPYMHRLERRFMPVKKAREWFPKKIAGYTLASLDIIRGDRVLEFSFSSGYRLVFEMTGRHTNIVVIEPDGTVAGATRKVTDRQSGVRAVKSGEPYEPPPPRSFPDPLWTSFQSLSKAVDISGGTVVEALAGAITAGSRLFAREATVRSGLDPDEPSELLGDDTMFRLLTTVAELQALAEKGGDGATIIRTREGIPRDVLPFAMQSAGPDDEGLDDLNEAIRRYSIERERGLELNQLRRSIMAVLSREEKGLKRTRKKIERERTDDSMPDDLDRMGNTILANLYVVKKGMDSAVLTDPYDGGEVDVVLDPTMDGPANAQRCFTRARKLREAENRAVERLDDIDMRLEAIRSEQEMIDGLEDIKTLRKKAAEWSRKSGGPKGGDPDRPFPRRFMSVSGLEIIVGRHDKENDELLKWARKNDLWLHAQGVGGSHVILRQPSGKQEPDHRSVEQAAAIAAYYSQSKTSSLVPVAATKLKYVVKRRGQGPGQVTYTREKVYFVEPGLSGGEKA